MIRKPTIVKDEKPTIVKDDEKKSDGRESYSSFDEYLDFAAAVSTLRDYGSSLLSTIRSQLDERSIDKKALVKLVLMLDCVVSETKEWLLWLTPKSWPIDFDEIKRSVQLRLNETTSKFKHELELKRYCQKADWEKEAEDYWEERRREEEEEEERRREEDYQRHLEFMGWDD